ncbi:hypothetical protein AAC387_Pa06g1868 [Persea americana]
MLFLFKQPKLGVTHYRHRSKVILGRKWRNVDLASSKGVEVHMGVWIYVEDGLGNAPSHLIGEAGPVTRQLWVMMLSRVIMGRCFMLKIRSGD